MEIQSLLILQKDFFKSQQTKDVAFRKAKLKLLKLELEKRENDIAKALFDDFRKPEFESAMTEIGVVLAELSMSIKKLHCWAKPKCVLPALLNFPSTDKIYSEPYGAVLLIAPWNYPFQLVFSPLIGAVAAGNTVVIKPSELTPNTSKIVAEIIEKVFNHGHVCVVEGDVSVATEFLRQRWDYIFFTGSIAVGKIVAKAAAEHLTPTTLELGGKNPCVVDETANLKLAAKRIVWGKFINCGQTCIAPDYVLVHEGVEKEFADECKKEIKRAYGENIQQSPDYCCIINSRNFENLKHYLDGQKVLFGGETDIDELYFSPTLLDNPALDSVVMKQEIFGPILPIIRYKTETEINTIVGTYEKPLAFYIFSSRKDFIKRMLVKHSFGGGTVNDTVVHFANHRLPFGGVGFSGMGAYHGKRTFDIFSHKKGVADRKNWLDLPVRYAPYTGKLKTLKFFMKWLS
jgi:aldehyde dehydrogenase (NAD+)